MSTAIRRRRARVGVVASLAPWRARFVSHVTEHDGRIDLTVVRDPSLLDAASFDAVIVDDAVPFAESVCVAQRERMVVFGLYAATEPTHGAGRASLEQLGVEPSRLLPQEASPSDVVEAIVGELRLLGVDATAPGTIVGLPRNEPPNDGGDPLAEPTTNDIAVLGNVLAVGGPDPILACELAAAVAVALRRSTPTALVDLDRHRLVATRVGSRQQPSVGDLVRALGRHGEVDARTFAAPRRISAVELDFDVLPAPPTFGEASALTGVQCAAALVAASASYPAVVTTLDGTPSRHDGAPSAAMQRCAHLLVAADACPTSIGPLLDWLSAAEGLPPTTVVFVGDVTRRRRRNLLYEARRDLAGLDGVSVHVLRQRDAMVRRSRWNGEPVRGRFVRSCRRFVDSLLAELDDAAAEKTSLDDALDGEMRGRIGEDARGACADDVDVLEAS